MVIHKKKHYFYTVFLQIHTKINNNIINFKLMKKSFLVAALLAVFCVGSAIAQPRAIGLNLGWGLEVSYQHGFSEANMLDVALSIPQFAGIGAKATYDWINPFNAAIPWNEKGQWNWYLGVGAAGGMYGILNPNYSNAWYVGAAGHVGIEYQFWFPLQLSFDWRPVIGVGGFDDAFGFNIGGLYDGVTLGVRYLF